MASQDAWADHTTLQHNLKYLKVDQLKQIVAHFNDVCGSNLTKSGKKSDLVDRLCLEIHGWRAHDSVEKWMRGKAIVNAVRMHTAYVPPLNADPSHSGQGYIPPVPQNVPFQGGQASRYGYGDPRQVLAPTHPLSAAQHPTPIRFKYSPFFKVEKNVSSIVACPESTTSMDRRSQTLNFIMTSEILSKLNSTSAKYQLRLYCTSSTFYTPPGTTFVTAVNPCPIEFPPTCEVRVNGVQLTANLKGLKKKPGTAPPPDLSKVVRTAQSSSNRVEMIYVNSQQPTPPKKYYLVVMLVEVTTVDQLLDRLRKGKYKSKSEVLTDMNKGMSDDDDIVAGHQKMSLKCPLSYMRITTPSRAKTCPHPQCFDAMSWYSVMEQTTTWMCPVCDKVLNVEDLYIDGYFDDILKQTPEDVEDVIVEADGQWHTEDNKYGSPEWLASHPSAPPPKPAVPVKRAPSPTKPSTNGVGGKERLRGSTPIEISDSEDEDEGRVKRELSPSTDSLVPRSSQSQSVRGSQPTRSRPPAIIDLTLSDDDEPPPPRPSVSNESRKRKELDDMPSPTEQIWKKSRTDSSSSPVTAAFNDLVNSSTLRMAEEAASARRLPPLPSSSQSGRYSASSSSQPSTYRVASTSASGSQPYGSSSLGHQLPPSNAPRRALSSSHDQYRTTLPPIAPPYAHQRGSGAGSSSPHHWR